VRRGCSNFTIAPGRDPWIVGEARSVNRTVARRHYLRLIDPTRKVDCCADPDCQSCRAVKLQPHRKTTFKIVVPRSLPSLKSALDRGAQPL